VIEYETGSLIDEVLPAPGFAAPGLPAFVEENRPTSLWVHEVFHKEMQAGNSVSWGIGYALTSNSVEMEGRAREAGAFFGSGREFHPVTGNLVWTGENSVWNGYIGGDPNDHAAFMSGP
jgi:hypothetical protein